MTDHFCPIDHIAIDVVEFDTALAFFKDVFGMTVTRFQGPEETPNSVWLDGGVQLCRVETQAADTGRVGHIAFSSKDLDGLLERAARYGAEGVPGKPRHWFSCLGLTFEIK